MKNFTHPAGNWLLATKNYALLLGLILIICSSVFAEAPPVQEWVARYNGPANNWDSASALAVDNSGNVYVTGNSNNSNGYPDYATVKYGPDGNQLWAARYNGSESHYDEAHALAVDNSGNVYVTGRGDYSDTDSDYATVKYRSSDGNEFWVRRYNGPANGSDVAQALSVDNSGNVYVTGSADYSVTHSDYATIKYSPDGNQLWVAHYNGPGNSTDIASDLAVDSSGNVYVTGFSTGSGGVYFDYATIKYSPDGNQLWASRYNGPGNTEDLAYALAIDNSGNVYVTGQSYASNGYGDYATIKYSPDGNQLWVSRYNGDANDTDYARDLAVDNSGNVYITGCSFGDGTSGDYATVKYSTGGVPMWVARYNGPGNSYDSASALAVDSSGNTYITGYSYDSGPGPDYTTVKYDPDGNQLWVVRYTGPGDSNDLANALAIDNSGNVYVTGWSEDIGTSADYATIKYGQQSCEFCIYVDTNATGDNNGSSWANAYNYLQDALTAADPNYAIWVAQATYRPDQNTAHPGGTGSRTATFQLKNGVALYGGFPAGGGTWSSRNPNIHQTILSGDIGVVDNNSDNSYHVVTGSGTDSNAVLDGFTITAGNAISGGGIYNYYGSPTVTNCTFSGNSAYSGGGIYNEYSSNPTVTNCTFSGNLAYWGYGGGMCNFSSNPTVTNCTFTGNSAVYYGGGIYNENSTPTLTNCNFSGNSAIYYGGGAYNYHNSNLTLTNCNFSGNSAPIGRGMYSVINIINIGAGGSVSTADEFYFDAATHIRGTGSIVVELGGELVVDSNAVVDLNDPNDPNVKGTIQCDGLITVKDNGQLKHATVNISRQGDGYFGKFEVEGHAQATNLDIHSDGDRFMDVDPCTFTGTIANNRIYVTITEGQNGTQEGKLELRGRDFTVPPCPNEPNCQIDSGTMPAFDTTSWTLERLELAPGARVALVDRFSSGNGDHEVLYVKDLVLGADSNLNYGFERFYYTNFSGDSNAIFKGAFFGFSLGDVNLDSNEEFESRIINNNYINPEDPCSNRIHVERVVGLEPEPNGMMKMSNLEDTNGQIISARAKSEFAPCNEDEIRIRLNYLFTTTDPNTRIVIYLSDIPEMGDLNDANHYKEVAQIAAPPVPRPGSAGSGRYGNFEAFVSTWGLNLTNGTWIELVLVEPQFHFLRYGGAKGMDTDDDEHAIVFTSGMGAGVYCDGIGICLDLDWSNQPDVGDFLIVVSGSGTTDPTCADGAFSSDGYDDSYDSDSWDWTINLEGRANMCIYVPMHSGAKGGGGGGFMHLNNPLNLINPSDLNDLLISGKRGTADVSTKMKDRLYVFNSSPHYLRLSEPALENRNIRVVRGEVNDLYQINSRDGITRLDDGSPIVPSNGGAIACPNEPRYKGNAKVYVGIQGTGDASFGRPIFDAAFNANDTNVYVVPVVVVPEGSDPYDENLPYAAAAKLHLTPGSSPPYYQLVKLYDGNIIPGDNQRQYRNTLREIELDDACNVYVTNAHAFNACDILWKFEPNEAVRRLDLDPCDPCKPHVRGPTGLCVSSATKVLYLTSSLYNDADPNSKVIYGFSTVDFNLVRTITVHRMQHVTGITEDPSTRALWITGYDMNCVLPRFPDSPSSSASPFYDPYLAKVPVGVNDVNAVCILDANYPDYDLAMPLSIVWTGSRAQEKCGGADLNKNGTVSLADLAMLAHYWLYTNCAALNNCEGADLQPEALPDGDVDIWDLDILTEHWLNTNCQ